MNKNNYNAGILQLMIATFLFGLYGVISRVIGINFGIFFFGWSRSALIAFIVFCYFLFARNWLQIRKRDYKWFITMSIFGIVNFLTIFVAFNRLPIGIALFSYFASSTITGYYLGHNLFKEKVTLGKLFLLFISLAGLFLLFHSRFQEENIFYLLLACFSGIAGAIWNIFSKKVSPTYPITEIMFVDSLLIVTLCLPLSLFFNEAVSIANFSGKFQFIILFAIITIGSNVFSLAGLKRLPAQIASIIFPLETVFGVILGWIFFKEILSPLEMIGGVLIIFPAILAHFIAKDSQENLITIQ